MPQLVSSLTERSSRHPDEVAKVRRVESIEPSEMLSGAERDNSQISSQNLRSRATEGAAVSAMTRSFNSQASFHASNSSGVLNPRNPERYAKLSATFQRLQEVSMRLRSALLCAGVYVVTGFAALVVHGQEPASYPHDMSDYGCTHRDGNTCDTRRRHRPTTTRSSVRGFDTRCSATVSASSRLMRRCM